MPKCSQVRGKCVRDLCSHLQGVALPPGHLSSHCLIPGREIILGIASSLQGPSGSWKNREQMPPGAWKSSPTRARFPGPATLGLGGVGVSLPLLSRPGN